MSKTSHLWTKLLGQSKTGAKHQNQLSWKQVPGYCFMFTFKTCIPLIFNMFMHISDSSMATVYHNSPDISGSFKLP